MQPFTSTPLLVAQLFSYAPHPCDYAPLRRALGARAGVEGFAAAAVWQRVPHLLMMNDDGEQDGVLVKDMPSCPSSCRYEPLSEGARQHPARGSVDSVVLSYRTPVEELGWAWLCIDMQLPRCRSLVVHLPAPMEASTGVQRGIVVAAVKCSPSSLVVPAAVDGGDHEMQQHQGRALGEWRLEESFLCEHASLTSLDLRGLVGLTTIDDSFASLCDNLTQVNLSCFTTVTTIGSDFLSECPALTSVDLSALTNVVSIYSSFLAGCSALASLDLLPLRIVRTIREDFMARCESLTSVDLSAMKSLEFVGKGCLDDCPRLTESAKRHRTE